LSRFYLSRDTAVKVTEWLAEKGFLQNIAGSKRKTLTDKSSLIGITQEERISSYDNKAYIINLYGRETQQFIIEHIRDISLKML